MNMLPFEAKQWGDTRKAQVHHMRNEAMRNIIAEMDVPNVGKQ